MVLRTLAFTLSLALPGACTAPLPGGGMAMPGATGSSALGDEVQVTGGVIRGLVDDQGLKQYHGIPYAAPPTGDLRWAPPAAPAPWQGIRDASKPGPACMQPDRRGSFYDRGEAAFMSEDCLTLNVWSRAARTDAALPVMVWIHGGSLINGSGSSYSGDFLTARGVVLVTLNYRLGAFGFHARSELSAEHPRGVSGNQGFRDQIAALHWVQENIGRFGGDASNVTLFGESAGAWSISALQASPLARGLFHRVIGQSGGLFQPMWYRDRVSSYADSAENLGQAFAQALAGEGGDTRLHALRQLPAQQVLMAFGSDPAFANVDALPIVDGEVLPAEIHHIFARGEQADVPTLVGSNAYEGSTFLGFMQAYFGAGEAGFDNYIRTMLPEVADAVYELYPTGHPAQARDSWIQAMSDARFTWPMRLWAQGMEPALHHAYLYWFTRVPPLTAQDQQEYGAFHGAELGYIFGDPKLFGARPVAQDYALAALMADIWTQFARTGDPNTEGLPPWPVYDSEQGHYMELGLQPASGRQLRMQQVALIRRAWTQRRKQAWQTPAAAPAGDDS